MRDWYLRYLEREKNGVDCDDKEENHRNFSICRAHADGNHIYNGLHDAILQDNPGLVQPERESGNRFFL